MRFAACAAYHACGSARLWFSRAFGSDSLMLGVIGRLMSFDHCRRPESRLSSKSCGACASTVESTALFVTLLDGRWRRRCRGDSDSSVIFTAPSVAVWTGTDDARGREQSSNIAIGARTRLEWQSSDSTPRLLVAVTRSSASRACVRWCAGLAHCA